VLQSQVNELRAIQDLPPLKESLSTHIESRINSLNNQFNLKGHEFKKNPLLPDEDSQPGKKVEKAKVKKIHFLKKKNKMFCYFSNFQQIIIVVNKNIMLQGLLTLP